MITLLCGKSRLILRDSLDKRDEPARKSYISETSAPPRFERTARRPRAPPPARAIYFRTCLHC